MVENKTIFIPIERAAHVRNLLLHDFFRLLYEKYKIVFLVSDQDSEFYKKFGASHIESLIREPLYPFRKRLKTIFTSIHRALIYNPSSEVFAGWGRGTSVNGLLLENGELVKYKQLRIFCSKFIFGKLLAWNFVRSFFKWLDRQFFPCNLYDELIKKYKPSLVFITSISSDNQVALLRNCKARGVPSVGMASSWDNTSKWGFREKVGLLAVWSDYMKDESVYFQGYKRNEIMITGVPQFDHYFNPKIYSKDDFVSKFGLDSTKKTILFGSEGPICPDDPYIVSFLQEKIKDGTISGCQVLVRPHFGYGAREIDRFLTLVDNKTVFMDNFFEVSKFKDGTALSLNTVTNLIAEIRYSDAFITSASTLVLDTIANGKQPILYNFDKDKSRPFKESVKRLYNSLWFKEIFKFGLDNVANNEDELIDKVREIISNPDKDLQKRIKLLQRFCYRVDGDSGKRLFEVINNFILKFQW